MRLRQSCPARNMDVLPPQCVIQDLRLRGETFLGYVCEIDVAQMKLFQGGLGACPPQKLL